MKRIVIFLISIYYNEHRTLKLLFPKINNITDVSYRAIEKSI